MSDHAGAFAFSRLIKDLGGVTGIVPRAGARASSGAAGNAGWVFLVIGAYESIHGSIVGRNTRLVRERCSETELTAPAGH